MGRRGFAIRLKRLKPRAPNFGDPKILGIRRIWSILVITFVFLYCPMHVFLLCHYR